MIKERKKLLTKSSLCVYRLFVTSLFAVERMKKMRMKKRERERAGNDGEEMGFSEGFCKLT